MSQHATVIEILPIWVTQHQRPVLRLELPNGKRASIPEGMTAKVGDVVAVLSEREHRLIETYRENVNQHHPA